MVLPAKSLPSTVVPPLSVIEVLASIFPINLIPVPAVVPKVAELPTCQKTLQDWAWPVRTILLLSAIVSVEPAWNIKTAFGSPPPSSVRVPVTANELEPL